MQRGLVIVKLLRSELEGRLLVDFAAIATVKLGAVHFVVVGHRRVALACRSGGEMIDADVAGFVTRVPLPAGADMLEVVVRQRERFFLKAT